MGHRGVHRFPYPAALRLELLGLEHWAELDGQLAESGVDLSRLSARRFCNLVYARALRAVTPEERDRFEADLRTPIKLPWANKRKMAVAERELEMALFERRRRENKG